MGMKMALFALAALVGSSVSVEFEVRTPMAPPSVSFVISTAVAQRGPASPRGAARRTGRRTARRTSYRVARRTSIAGCPYRAPYYYCDGVYYRRVVESGTTVYVVVNP